MLRTLTVVVIQTADPGSIEVPTIEPDGRLAAGSALCGDGLQAVQGKDRCDAADFDFGVALVLDFDTELELTRPGLG